MQGYDQKDERDEIISPKTDARTIISAEENMTQKAFNNQKLYEEARIKGSVAGMSVISQTVYQGNKENDS